MCRAKIFLFLAFTVCAVICSRAATANVLIWQTASDRVTADVRGESLFPLLQDIAHQTGWHIFVEPEAARTVDVKFTNLASGDALRKLLGNLNFAFVPQTNGPDFLYVFTTTMQNATKPVTVASTKPKHAANQLMVRVKPGTDIDALAKKYGAKVVGRMDKFGIYLLQFADADATDAALAELKNDSDVLGVDYNYYLDPPPSSQLLSPATANLPKPLSLSLNPPNSDCSQVVVGLVDTAVQPLGDLDKFIQDRISIVDTPTANNDILHGTGIAQNILAAAAAQKGGTSIKIVSAAVMNASESATTFNVALGVQAVVNAGATVVNLSLGGAGQSQVLGSLIQSAEGDGVVFFAAAGNTPVATPTYPAAYPGVNAVTALGQSGQLANYANYGNFVDMALPGSGVVYLGNQAYLMQGTSVSTGYATGVAAGNEAASCAGWAQIQAAMQQKFRVPTQ